MTLHELAEKIVDAVNSRSKTSQRIIRNHYDSEWRLVCLISSGWIAPDGLTATGRKHIDLLAREVGVIEEESNHAGC
jgi:hypothetical protein